MAFGGRPWFRPYAYGVGCTPSTWQGWALTAGLATVLVGVGRSDLMARDKLAASLVCIAAAAGVSWAKTDGGWRWRWSDRG